MTKNSEKPLLEPRCEDCASLCCVVFAFDRSESFGFDKAPGQVCPNLNDFGKCSIFDDRAKHGFSGCITYDCFGAGQRVTQEVFGGRNWRDEPRLTARMGDALAVLRQVHEQLVLLVAAENLPLDNNERAELAELRKILAPERHWTEESLQAFPVAKIVRKVSVFLTSLRRHVDVPD